ncbi:MAG: ATP-binding protein [Gallionella sp.]
MTATLMGIAGIVSVNEERIALQNILRRQGNAVAQYIAADSVEALISEDYPELNMVLQTIGRESGNIMLIEVSHDGRVVARYSNMSQANTLVFQADVMLHNTDLKEWKLGEVKLLVSEHDNEAIIAARIKSLSINMLMAFVLLSLILRYLLRNLVVKRIEQLKLLIQQVIATELPEQPGQNPTRNRSQDEIDALRECFVSMLDGLQSRDVARTAMLAEIAAARTLLVDVTNAMHSALIVVSQDGTITFCNRAAMAATEGTEDVIVGKPLCAVFPYPEEDHCTILDAVHEFRSVDRLAFNKLVGEQLRFFEAAVYPLSSVATGGAVILIDDVTERVRFEEVMVQTDKMASVGGLAAGVAHEINNPLGVMVQAAQNIERRVSDSLEANHRVAAECGTTVGTIRTYLEKRHILEFLDDIKSDGARAARIVQSLLEFSRKSESKRDPVLMEALFNQTIELAQKDYDLKKKMDFRQIKIVIEVDPALPPVPMVRSQIEQVLLNLLKNSAQALTEKIAAAASGNRAFTPQITLRARLDAGRARIEVKDNGTGFSAETRRRAFEPFFTTKPPGSGTGLGLWIAYIIVTDKHGGAITLDSAPGKGCTFIITLPLEPGNATC